MQMSSDRQKYTRSPSDIIKEIKWQKNYKHLLQNIMITQVIEIKAREIFVEYKTCCSIISLKHFLNVCGFVGSLHALHCHIKVGVN